MADAAARQRATDQLGHQVHVAMALRGVDPDAQQQLDTRQAQLHALDLVDHVHRHAIALEFFVDRISRRAAFVQQRAQHIEALAHGLARRVRRAGKKIGGRIRQRKERGVFHAARQARADVLAETGRADLTDEHLHAAGQCMRQAPGKRVGRGGGGRVRVVRSGAFVPVHQRAHAGQCRVVQRLDPLRVAGAAKQQGEQPVHVAAVGGRGQHPVNDAAPQFAPEAGLRCDAGVAKQCGGIVVHQHRPQRGCRARGHGGIVFQHLQQVAQPRVAGIPSVLPRRCAARPVQPAAQVDEPQIALGQRRLRIGIGQDDVELRPAPRSPPIAPQRSQHDRASRVIVNGGRSMVRPSHASGEVACPFPVTSRLPLFHSLRLLIQ